MIVVILVSLFKDVQIFKQNLFLKYTERFIPYSQWSQTAEFGKSALNIAFYELRCT